MSVLITKELQIWIVIYRWFRQLYRNCLSQNMTQTLTNWIWEALQFHTIPVPSYCSQKSQPLAEEHSIPTDFSSSITHILSFIPFVRPLFLPFLSIRHFHTAVGARSKSPVLHTLPWNCIIYKLKTQCHDLKKQTQINHKTKPHLTAFSIYRYGRSSIH